MNYRLDIETDSSTREVFLKLYDDSGVELSNSQVRLANLSPSLLQGLFDTRAYVERYSHPSLTDAGAKSAEKILADLGTSLGLEILGNDIMDNLSGSDQRTLIINLPTVVSGDALAAAVARIPWEVARKSPTEKPLFEQNVFIRTVLSGITPVVANDTEYDPLRILFVFTEMPGSHLSMRLEREQLLNLFFGSILPQRIIEIDVLCYGISRQCLMELIHSKGGYNIIHWSGHGNYNCLELRDSEGNPDPLSGQGFIQLIIDAGGIIPQLVFLSSCLSGAFVNIHDWTDFHEAMSGTRAARLMIKSRETSDPIQIQPGYTGVALELLRGGIPQVIAMKYEIGDDYARELAQSFYRYLLGDITQHSVENALSLSRGEMVHAALNARSGRRECPLDDIALSFHPVDHVTPVFFGASQQGFRIKNGVSQQLHYRDPQPQPLLPCDSGDFNVPETFVGRIKELTQIAHRWLPDGASGLALIQGLGGMGKTTLAAEIIHIWHSYFDYVFVFQSKNRPLEPEEFLYALDLKLRAHSQVYRDIIKRKPDSAVYLTTGGKNNGSDRDKEMCRNLIEVLRTEKILLVFDNFETNLEIESSGQTYKCKKPYWDELILELTKNLLPTGSRAIVTSRQMLRTLVSAQNTLLLPLGPLSKDELSLFIHDHDALNKLYQSDLFGQQLVYRLMTISRGHPLILKYLSSFASEPQRLDDILTRLESNGGWQALPDLFTDHLPEEDHDREREYLEQATRTSIDLIIQGLSLHARRLLWIITLANESVSIEILDSIWKRQTEIPDVIPLLKELQHSGMVYEESENEGFYSYHEIVRERMLIWMATHADECKDLDKERIWLAYAGRYEILYYQLVTSGLYGAMDTAEQVLLRAIKYYVLTRDFDSVGDCASRIGMTIANPIILLDVISEISNIVNDVPEGSARWRLLSSLGGLYAKIGAHDQANELFIRALDEAKKAGNWRDLGITFQNWATTFVERGDFANARRVFSKGRDYQLKAGMPLIYITMSEVECLRIDVYQGKASESWPKIEKRLKKMRDWWQQYRRGQTNPEAPDPTIIGIGFVSCLDVAALAKMAIKSFDKCLELNDEMIQVQKDLGETELQLARSQLNRCQTLCELNCLDEAQTKIEACLDVFRGYDSLDFQVQALNALAGVWYKRRDYDQAISIFQQGLAICNGLPNPIDRAKFHSNLSLMYRFKNNPEENTHHRLASIIYNVVTSHLQDLTHDLQLRESDIRHFNEIQKRCNLPRLHELIALPEFFPLYQFLIQSRVSLDELQTGLDRLEEDIRKDV